MFDTLRGSQLDWLVFELIDGIRAGRAPIEPPENLMGARSDARTGARRELPFSPPPEPMPIEGDDQVEWAVAYVCDRMEATVAEMEACARNLTVILGDGVSGNVKAKPISQSVQILLQDDGPGRQTTLNDASAARAELPRLRKELEAWSAQVRNNPQP
ncbi:hypothetical protein QN222_22360 [Sinorhizobium sp. 6-70]|nr:hypothetical protein [Sinorhizobium sp. 6-70]